MNKLRNKVVQRLEVIPDDKLQEVLSFLNYLVWQSQNPQTQEDIGITVPNRENCTLRLKALSIKDLSDTCFP